MSQKIKITALVLISCFICLSIYSRSQPDAPSIVGKWTKTKSTQISRHEDKGYSETTSADYEGCSLTITPDNHFQDIGSKSTTEGNYVINGDILKEIIPASNKSVEYKIELLTDHELRITTTGHIEEPPTAIETTYIFTR